VQVAEHPSRVTRLPSSQVSAPETVLSPQTEQVFGLTRRLQTVLASIMQVEEHPSPLTKFPSSQASITPTVDLTPLPHLAH
jgi:hypothetical protein